jgi:lipoprotein-releasing system permease protein
MLSFRKVAIYFETTIRKGSLAPVYWMTWISVWLSTVILLFSFAITYGFKSEIIQKISGFAGHITISTFSSLSGEEQPPLSLLRLPLQNFREHPSIKHVYPYVLKGGVIKTDSALWGLMFKGVDENYDWSFFKKNLIRGRLPSYTKGKSSNEIVLSEVVCRKLRLEIDSPVRVYYWVPGDPSPRGRRFNLVGIYHTGFVDYDQFFGICDMRHLQKLNKWDSTLATGVEIIVKNFNDIDAVKSFILSSVPYDLKVEDIREKHPQFFDWLSALNTNITILLILMSVVVFVNVLALLLVIVFKHIPMIGLLKALGATPAFIRQIFSRVILRIVFPAVGVANLFVALVVVVQNAYHWLPLNEEMYYLSYVPMLFRIDYFLEVNLLILIITMLCLVLPLQIIRRISPSKALTYR